MKIALQGTSMLPTLHDEDFIVLEPITGEPAIGDVDGSLSSKAFSKAGDGGAPGGTADPHV